jgi:hypothetical protein
LIGEIAVGSVVGLGLGWAIRSLVAQREHAQDGLRTYGDRFLELGRALAEHEALDESHLKKIGWYALNLTQWRTFWILLVALRSADANIRAGQTAGRVRVPASAAGDWHAMFYAWMMAVSYSRPLMGIWMRAKIAKILDPSYPPSVADSVIQDHLPASSESLATA